ncbi:MerR family transcriptional regulator [uncultured Clostridium sp.]|uniref:MerR family transcriptional regulator n=1 Tax=uncultured Clostridium sp. TaxID=59620 RepID=UPI002616B869|nr:MerR family transcriptional regulator [uncultured Clostridium sp.]
MCENMIKGEDNIRYSATQVGEMFDLPVSTVRHYMTAFSEILGLEYNNKMRKFTKASLNKFEFILKLREDGLTIQQIKAYCEKNDIFNEEVLIPNNKPLALDLFTESIKLEIQAQLEMFRSNIQRDIRNELKLMVEAQYKVNEDLKQEIYISLDNMIDKKLNYYLDKTSENNKFIENKIEQQKKVLEEIKEISCVSKEEIERISYKESFGRRVYKFFFKNK